MSKIPPRPALIPGLAPLRGEAVQRRHESDLTRATARDPTGLAERAGRTEGGARQFRIVTFEAIKERGIADAKVSVQKLFGNCCPPPLLRCGTRTVINSSGFGGGSVYCLPAVRRGLLGVTGE